MDSYLYLYTNKYIEMHVYKYIGWDELRKYDNISDNIWKQICEDYCCDEDFKCKFKTYWIPECRIGATYQELFLCFISSQIKYLCNSLIMPATLPNILLKSRDFVVLASKRCSKILWYMDPWLRSDKEIVLNAVRQDISILECASQELKRDKPFMLLVERNKSHNSDVSVLNYVDDTLKSDKQWILKFLKFSGMDLNFVDGSLKSDPDVVLTAVLANFRAFQFAHDNLKSDRNFVLKLVSKSGRSLKYAVEFLKDDREIALAAVKESGYAIEHVSDRLKLDQELALIAIKQNSNALQYIDVTLKTNRSFMMTAMKYSKNMLVFDSDPILRSNKEIITFAKQYNMIYL